MIDVWKFRSMRVHAEQPGHVTQATRRDTRITRFGAFLRRTSLDELPQFINVLQGTMSIVGPRPHAVAHNHYYKTLVQHYMQRHRVKPGITGWAQVNGLRGETDTVDKMAARVEYDMHYMANWSLGLDLRIIALTAVKGFFRQERVLKPMNVTLFGTGYVVWSPAPALRRSATTSPASISTRSASKRCATAMCPSTSPASKQCCAPAWRAGACRSPPMPPRGWSTATS